ncbi:NADH-quinone oxidoreductase subunit N [Actinorhabdospora filicis]|uniref:NADH-quinone oxidoreductase subunit N n=1 Tax=Actinorhabdospora filicis TaxID=1785913 RepID=A0A9W6SPR9_9ACTN|nr:NADH-quinone oxidoreductase subunit NuoN [Actinorhabdospora filicis]GLZ80729.1 NADH-quinone oxidoreductase subunit N [Actinorhabdospora filicis]
MNDIQLPPIDYAALLPMLIVFGLACVGILAEAFVPRKHRFAVQATLTLAALIAGLVTVIINRDLEVTTIGGAVTIDGAGLFLQGIILVLGIVAFGLIAERRLERGGAFVANAAHAADSDGDKKQLNEAGATEIFPLTLFAIAGMMLFCVSGDLLTMFVALEVFSLPLYLMCGLARRRRLLSQESALKYFLLGAFASAFFLYGVALIYGYAGSVQLVAIKQSVLDSDKSGVLLAAGLALLAIGLLFKAAAVPFHVWTPDVYQGAPTPITALMAACVKAAAFGGLLRVFNVAFETTSWDWRPVITAVAMATMIVGSILAVTQTDIKRLLAYSSIANAGYLLVGVVSLGGAVGSSMFYLVAYGFSVLAAFGMVTLVRDADGEATHLSRWAGLGKGSPLFSAMFTIIMLGFAGIPLTSGFSSKFALFSSAWDANQSALVIVGVLSSVVLAFPYLKVVVLLWLNPPGDETPTVSVPGYLTRAVVGVGVLATIVLGVAPSWLLDMVNSAGTFLAK